MTDTHLAPIRTEDAVASADGKIAAAVTANRVRSLRKKTAPKNYNAIDVNALKRHLWDQKMSAGNGKVYQGSNPS